ncbi:MULTISPECIES: tetratricopeptide repeat protein [Legionella]|uniref:PelB C-terminal domain-containing protein n=1 Tax=Legionella drozanskii LLAP-1 TaxID=1212489 RepID=A0A0W0SS35_9GAMM|nr:MULTISPECIES: tetratricopeptide repeat protein [Legionella]KTC85781.1 hypothetical protein Ldro_2106 [Legionella drozanskii LLAP-1]PJE16625.1 MAG: hypothetical protein CK430_03060 [Legionella sp.]
MMQKKYTSLFLLYLILQSNESLSLSSAAISAAAEQLGSFEVNSVKSTAISKRVVAKIGAVSGSSAVSGFVSQTNKMNKREAATRVGTTTPVTQLSTASKAATISPDQLFQFTLPEEDDTKHQAVTIIKYDKDIYELAYSVYMQSNNPKGAYTIAMAATEQIPGSRVWRERLAQVSLWNMEPGVAIGEYLYLQTNFNDMEAGLKGKKLAETLHDDDSLAKFLSLELKNLKEEDNTTLVLWREYIETMLRLGNIPELMQVLNANQSRLPPVVYLDTIAHIYKITDDPNAQLEVLQKLAAVYGMVPDIAEALAQIYVLKGDVAQAQIVMNQARPKAQPIDFKFWRAYGTISLLANKPAEEIYSLQQLLKGKKPEVDIYSRLIELTTRNQPQLAYQYAMQGMVQHPNNASLASTIFSLMTRNRSLDFPGVVARIPAPLLKMLKYDPSYWYARSYYWRRMRDGNQLLQTYLEGINYVPEDPYFRSELIYFLVETNNLTLLRKVLPLWQSEVPETPILWGPYAEAYSRLNDPMMTRLLLSLFYQQFKEYEKDPYWLILFKDSLENSFFEREANEISYYTWPFYLELLRNQQSPPDYVQLVNYVKLSIYNAGGDPTAVALSMLEKHPTEDTELLMLTWALDHNNISLARAVQAHYERIGIQPPLWARMSIALARNDQRTMRDLLRDKNVFLGDLVSAKENVAYRDQISAADAINAIPYGQTYAFNALKRFKKDSDLYDNYFTPIMLKTANNIYFGEDYYQYGNVVGPRTNTSFTYFLMPSLSITPYNSVWFSHNLSKPSTTFSFDENNEVTSEINQELRAVPRKDERAGVKFRTLLRRGNLDLDLGYRNNLNSFMTAKLAREYQLYSDLDIVGTVGYHQPAEDTEALYVGGMKNDLELDFDYKLLFKDRITGNLQQNFFYTQQGQHVADGTQFTLRYEHKFWSSYPDWSISPYGEFTHYYNKTRSLLRGSILKLVPVNETPNANFLIPVNFTEYGITVSFGKKFVEEFLDLNIADEYTHRWRPFASATISKNTLIGIGKLYEIGISGTVFGRDHLLFYYEYGTNQGPGIQALRLATISYRIYM